MTIESSRRDIGIAPTAPAFWNNPSVRALFYQLVLVGGVIAVGAYLVHNTLENLARQGIATGFGFLHRGVVFPLPVYHPLYAWIGLALVIAIAASIYVKRWAHARQMATGEQFPVLRTSAALIIGLPLLVFVIGGMPFTLDKPELRGFNF